MKYLAAYGLAAMTNPKPSKDDVSKILKSVGAKVDVEELDFVFNAIGGRDVSKLIAEGAVKLAANAGAAGGAPAGGAAPAAAAAKDAKATEKKEEKKPAPKVEEEEEEDGMLGLFG